MYRGASLTILSSSFGKNQRTYTPHIIQTAKGATRNPIRPDTKPLVLLSIHTLAIMLTPTVKAAIAAPKIIPFLPLEYKEYFLRIKFTATSAVITIEKI